MAHCAHIKRNDIVQVMSGRDGIAEKSGKVLQVLPSRGKAVVEGVNFIKKNMRKSQDNPEGAIVEKEAPVRLSNLLLFCPKCKKGVRAARVKTESGKRVRKCKKCSHAFDE